jgi:DNA polymerase-1
MAINAPIQGTATADIIKLAMHHVDIALSKAGLRKDAFFVMQVHDELVFEVKEGVIDEVKRVVVDAMEGVLQNAFKPIKTDVPMLIDAGTGKTWGEAK